MSVELPSRYPDRLRAFAAQEISYGTGGLKLFSLPEIDAGQVGYSVSSDGEYLCTGDPGTWRQNWIVIGYETSCGDPLFMDSSDDQLPVFTAMHGEGSWEPRRVAISLEIFVFSFNAFAQIANGRANPVELEKNPLSEDDRASFLSQIQEWNGGPVEPREWGLLLVG
jgi:hypothetical protein